LDRPNKTKQSRYISIVLLLVVAAAVAYYVHLLRIGEAQKMLASIRHFGVPGILIGILLQAIVNILPVPGEFTTIVLMEIYGPVWGGVYSWIGGVIGGVGGMYLTKWVAAPLFGKMVEPFMSKLEPFMAPHQSLGLLLIRFVPLVPYHFVNYAAGLFPVKLWGFVWTTGVGILPYTVAMSGIYAGLRKGSLQWGIVGASVLVLLMGVSWYVKRRKKPLASRQ
jgi:uncharacterized membrane protein YdjX (TVP38/TMEM64 family)